MNKAFFERMKIFSYWVLGIGILGAAILAFTTWTIEVTRGYTYTYTERVFNPVGFGITIGSLLCIICLFYILKGVSLIGINSFQHEKAVSDQTTEVDKNDLSVAERPKENSNEQPKENYAPDKKLTIFALITISILIVGYILVFLIK